MLHSQSTLRGNERGSQKGHKKIWEKCIAISEYDKRIQKGQNALSQAKTFKEMVQVDGLVLTKLDGTAKGGILLALCREFGLPARFIGVGEKIDDLRAFDARDYARSLMGLADKEAL